MTDSVLALLLVDLLVAGADRAESLGQHSQGTERPNDSTCWLHLQHVSVMWAL